MSYLTGGLAYGEVKINGTSTISGTAGGTPFFFTEAFGHSHVNVGWVVGYGTEGRLATPGWTWKVEGLYMDLGHLDAAGQGGFSTTSIGTLSVVTTSATGLVSTHSHFTDGILRGGLNYHF